MPIDESLRNMRTSELSRVQENTEFQSCSRDWMREANSHKYSYQFDWLGRPIIQYPQDIIALQQIVWDTQPDLIIETGIAHGGSLILSASLLALLDLFDSEAGRQREPSRKVIGIDIDIRAHNRLQIESHPLSNRIQMIEGSSTSKEIFEKVLEFSKNYKSIMVILDSNHTHDHVKQELELYSTLVTKGNYIVVFDTVIEFLPADSHPDRPWGHGDNPLTAVKDFISRNSEFVVDYDIDNRLQISVAPNGYLKRL
jgi:cephalosporin hydroxylase